MGRALTLDFFANNEAFANVPIPLFRILAQRAHLC